MSEQQVSDEVARLEEQAVQAFKSGAGSFIEVLKRLGEYVHSKTGHVEGRVAFIEKARKKRFEGGR